MTYIKSLDTYIDNDKNYYGSFLIEPLEIGQGITLGNTLRRTLLSDLSSFAITGFRLNNIQHEFIALNSLREDILELILNLRTIIFKPTKNTPINNICKLKGFLNVKGPVVLTAGLFNLPTNHLTITNPAQYIGTILTASNLYLEIDIENNCGYKILNNNTELYSQNTSSNNFQKTFLIDTNFSPIKKVNYKIKLIYDKYGNIKESLFIEILTNGSLTPKRSLQEALKLVFKLFSNLLINFNNKQLSSLVFSSIFN